MIKAEIIADSRNEFGQRITSFVLTFPRIILAEINTHRMLSRNSASSRAIPFKRMVELCETNPFIPIAWMKDHSGMQGNEFFTDEETITSLKANYLLGRDYAVERARALAKLGLTKQIVNRGLEAYMYHTAIVTATEWENYIALRASDFAEIHLKELSYQMLDELNTSIPKQLKSGDWHIPFGDKMDTNKIEEIIKKAPYESMDKDDKLFEEIMVKIATARCARVSYMNFDGSDDYGKDVELADRLAKSGHWSAFEHCARAMNEEEFFKYAQTFPIKEDLEGKDYQKWENLPFSLVAASKGRDVVYNHGWCGNFRGFIQYRKMFENENSSDPRVIKK